ncbi:hypothetical protein A5N17_17425 [Arthrobacter sp. D2]|nr:hypothetical protein [Arthrobacter sp. M5]NKR16518.1 hypothetical protein [Arthrobacter sp. M6]OEH60113.1 hypothetical protein A5N17_17425 [Arthrobacter sp. D2]OEH63749.1 hypothetical protein A5N13_14070 [Arthrobacter sp. D4]
MAGLPPISPELQTRLVDLSALFVHCREAFLAVNDRYRWSPGPESGAAKAAADLPSPDPGVPDPTGETGHRMIAEVIQIFLHTASGHLGALASLYASAEVHFSPALLIRAVIENCAHAVWVLGNDPDESSENRLARAYLEELMSAEEARKNAGRMHTRSHTSYVQSDQAYKALKRQVLARFPDATREGLGHRQLNGQVLPGLESSVMWMYELTEKHGGTIGQDSASGIYGFLSNRTHPTLYPARQRRRWHDEGDGRLVAYLHVEIGDLYKEARIAVAAFYNALNYTISYFGWPTTEINRLEEQLEEAMPTFFRD